MGRYRNASLHIWLGFTLHEPLDLPKLPSCLLDDLRRRLSDGCHEKGAKDKGEHAADEQADDDFWLNDIDSRDPSCMDIIVEKHNGGEARRSYRKPLSDGRGRVSDGIKL